ncbi:exodeoxyribonuclease V subunit beta, partial [Nocardioides sp. GCM10030258]
AWWAPTKNAEASPLHRLLMRQSAADGSLRADVPVAPSVPDEDTVTALFAAWRDRGGPSPEVSHPAATTAPLVAESPGELSARAFTRSVDTGWRRTSYSSLSNVDLAAEIGQPGVDSEPEVEAKDDE